MNLKEIQTQQNKAYEIISKAWEEGSHEALADGYQQAFGLVDEALCNCIDILDLNKKDK